MMMRVISLLLSKNRKEIFMCHKRKCRVLFQSAEQKSFIRSVRSVTYAELRGRFPLLAGNVTRTKKSNMVSYYLSAPRDHLNNSF